MISTAFGIGNANDSSDKLRTEYLGISKH